MEKIDQRQLQKDLYNSNWQDYQHLDWDEAFHKGIGIGIEFANEKMEQENKLLKDRVRVLEELERNFYMDICRAYNAGKENMSKCIQCYADNDNDNEAFKSSHDYFVGEFPTFKTNVQ